MELSSSHAGLQTQMTQVLSMITHILTQLQVVEIACWMKLMVTHLMEQKQVMDMQGMGMSQQPSSLVFRLDSWVQNSEKSVDSHRE